MNEQTVVKTNEVLNIANDMEKLNEDIQTKLNDVKNIVMNLEANWSGDAATATRVAVDDFAKEYFNSYKEAIAEYVEFLRNNVSQGYSETEEVNTKLADQFD